ncbi:MAG: acyl-CoA thioesterase [Acidimicrobiia bacterium]
MEPYRRKVRYWDVDANGHVFNVRYLIYVDDAITDFFESRGIAFQDHEEEGFLMVLAHTEIDFKSEAVIGDVLDTTITVEELGRASLTLGFEVIDIEDGRKVATGSEVYVAIDPETRKAIELPDKVREQFQP